MTDFDPGVPYNKLPKLPPSPADLETPAVLKKCISARVALAELKQAAELIPNSTVLVNALPMLEAQASSEIENIVTTTDKLFVYADVNEKGADPATKEALRYRRALFEGCRAVLKGPLTTAIAIRVCRTIKGEALDIRDTLGTNLRNSASREIIYTPPEGHALLLNLLANWEEFLHADTDLDPLVRMAIQHYQFEAIHPFSDGNGRTGRILNILFLVEQELLSSPILYLSRHIIRNKRDYYERLLGVTHEGAWERWIMYVLDGVEETCLWTTEKIKAIRELMQHTSAFVQKHLPKIYSRELVELMFMQPYCRIGNVVDAGLAKRQTASVYLKQLCEIGVLREFKAGREAIFVHPKYVDLLTVDENVWVYYAGVETEIAMLDKNARAPAA